MRKRTTPMSLALALVLAGCAGYDRGSESRTFGEVTDDVSIQTVLKTRLLRDPLVGGLAIDTEVRRGEVRLYGRVDSEEARARALEIARGVRGVDDVLDRLVVVD